MNDAARYRDEIRKLQRCILRLKRKLDSRERILRENEQLRHEVRVLKGRETTVEAEW